MTAPALPAVGATLAPGRRSTASLAPDPGRVIAQLFVPGHALAGERAGRAANVVLHVLALSDAEVDAAMQEIVERFGRRHRDLVDVFEHHADRLASRVAPDVHLSSDRRRLLGATFTQEFAIESTAVCNPSAVPAADQTGLAAGELRAVLSIRQIGEGHRSTIGFRTLVVGRDGDVTIAPRSVHAAAGTVVDVTLEAEVFATLTADRDAESIQWLLRGLGARFDPPALAARQRELERQDDTRRDVSATSRRVTRLASRCYGVQFDPGSELAERVLTPTCAVESNGMEDARFVRFVDDDGTVRYHAPYTAYDGNAIAQQLLTTVDFERFTSFPLLGAGATNKGLALFPRRIGGRYHAMSRGDGARNAIAVSEDLRHWPTATPLATEIARWGSVQVGNCGSPIELAEGWLVLTHGVGPMRTYSIGAILLDLDDPTVVVGQTAQPLISPSPDEQDGYVPNVVYSCGALRHGDRLVVPLGIADQRVAFSTFRLTDILAAMSDRPAPISGSSPP